MKIWVGHYKGNPKEWFVVWAKSKREAFLQIDPITGEPDMQSLKELTAPGFFDFAVDLKEDYVETRPSDDGWMLVLGGALGQTEDALDYIYELVRNKAHSRPSS